jgi:hypothetical protein
MLMPNRTAKFVSAVFASILAGAPLTTTSHSETVATDDCLAGPKGPTPAGSHWYYRIDHPTNRHCWYLREEGDKLSQAAPQNTSPSAKLSPPEAETAMQQSVANAHAELPAQSYRNETSNPALPANAAGLNDTFRANAPHANTSLSVVASRWPEPSGVSPASGPRLATANVSANTSANVIAATPPVVAPVTLTVADTSQRPPGSIPMLLAAVVGALALAGISASLIFRFGRARRGQVRARRGPIRDSTDDDRIALSDQRAAPVLPRRTRFSRGFGEAGDPNDRFAEFFSQISERAAR